eukprot:GHVS01041437.1.p1 GENE.GHVS01041437.1~~GHVS01041437.1.p1  ORF type:complete len:435 (+),score=97.74 GHVS01041437.1:492-1796(+)
MNWPGLLKWSLSHSDGTVPSGHAGSMSAEDMKFLEAAIRDYLSKAEDPSKTVSQAALRIDRMCSNQAEGGTQEGEKEEEEEDRQGGETGEEKAMNKKDEGEGGGGGEQDETGEQDNNSVAISQQGRRADDDEVALLSCICLIQHCVDDHAEIARNLHKLNALAPLLRVLHLSPLFSSAVVEATLEVLAFSVQNNPVLQDAMMRDTNATSAAALMTKANRPWAEISANGLELFEHLVRRKLVARDDDASGGGSGGGGHQFWENPSSVQIKALSALANLIRQHRPSEEVFLKKGGMNMLVSCLYSENYKFQQKAAALAQHLILEGLVDHELVNSSKLPAGLCMLLSKRNISSTGIGFGETTVELVLATLKLFRPFLAKTTDLEAMQQAILSRQAYLHRLVSEGCDDDVSHEISQLTEAARLAKFPGMKKISKQGGA